MIKLKRIWKIGKKRIKIEVQIGDPKKRKNWVTLEETDIVPISFTGEIFIGKSFESCCIGQIVDKLPNDGELWEVKWIWKRYHLNDMIPGTKRQFWAVGGKFFEYNEEIKKLKNRHIYEDRGHIYGKEWLGKPVPKKVINRILEIFSPI